jgi:hypothetical protein
LQDADRFTGGGAGRDDVVDEEDFAICRHTSTRQQHPSSDVALASGAAKTG